MIQFLMNSSTLLAAHQLQIKKISVTKGGDWQLTLTNNIQVEVGGQQRMSRLQRLMDVYDKLVASTPSQIAKIDLRYPNGFSVSHLSTNN